MTRILPIILTVLMMLSSGYGSINLIKTDDNGVTVEYIPELESPATIKDQYVHLSLREGDLEQIPGQPLVPVTMITVAVPPMSNPRVRLIERRSGTVLKGRLPLFDSETAEEQPTFSHRQMNLGKTIGAPQIRTFSGLKTVRIPVYPVLEHHANSTVDLAERITFRVEFNAPKTNDNAPRAKPNRLARLVVLNAEQAAGWGKVSTAGFINHDWPDEGFLYKFAIDAEGIYRLTFEDLLRKGVTFPPGELKSERIKLYGNGGGELPLDPGEEAVIGLTELAIHVHDGGNGIFGPGDWFVFYGRGAGGWVNDSEFSWRYDINHYSLHNYYWLHFDSPFPFTTGLRMLPFHENRSPALTVHSAPINYHYEPEEFIRDLYTFVGSGRRWYGYTFDGASVSPISYSLNISSPDRSEPVRIRTRIAKARDYASPLINVSFNSETIGRVSPGDSRSATPETFDVDGALLQEGYNSVSFEQLREGALAFFDWYELKYYGNLDQPRVFESVPEEGLVKYEFTGLNEPWIFDITSHNGVRVETRSDFVTLQRVGTNLRFTALTPDQFRTVTSGFEEYPPPDNDVNDLFSENNSYDALLIVPDGFWDAAKPLQDYYLRKNPHLKAARIRVSEIYNRFSGGLVDPGAIRNMLRYAAENWSDTLDFVTFCGDGDYNYRHINSPQITDFIPPYENDGFCTDDWLVDFTPYEDDGVNSPLPELVHGRLTVRSQWELSNVIDKIIAYDENPEFGPWRNNITFVADDERGEKGGLETGHIRSSEELCNFYLTQNFNTSKIYLTEYKEQWGREKPQAGVDLIETINRGTLLVNYMGHGNPTLWAHEYVFVMSRDLARIERSRKLPLYIAFTCDWAYWDDPLTQSFPEQLLVAPEMGAIGIIASTRLTYGTSNANLARRFFDNQFMRRDTRLTMGEALNVAKHEYVNIYSSSYHLLGDPTLQLAYPRLKGRFTAPLPDTLTPLALSPVYGQVLDADSSELSTFSGEIEILALDTKEPRDYPIIWYDSRGNEHVTIIHYVLPGATIYRGLFSVNEGTFSGRFVTPRDVSLGGELGRIVGYYHDDNIDGIMALDNIVYADRAADTEDNEPPYIEIFFDHRGFRTGNKVGPDPLLIVDVTDSSGINLTGAMGHGINLAIDNGPQIDLTPYFKNNLDDYQSGSLEYQMGYLEPGTHRIEIEAWDSFNNLSIKEIDVEVTSDGGGLMVSDVLNWPNPFNDVTQLSFVVNKHPVEYEIKVFTTGGRLIKYYSSRITIGKGINWVEWDGKDLAGRSIANGVYLYKVKARDEEGGQAEGLGRIAYLR